MIRETGEHVSHFYEVNATKLLVSFRIVFGMVFLFDGILKWALLATGNMQATVVGQWAFSSNPPAWLAANWMVFGTMVAVGETFGGLFLILGIFQRPAALWSFLIMFSIWVFGGFGGWYAAPGIGYQTDPGGDLMLALVFLLLVFLPTSAYSLSSYLRIRERLAPGETMKDKFLRTILC